jgi:peptide/nickel transport system substrate-binding protein
MTWVCITLASRWLDPRRPSIITPFMVLYALHDALVKPMPAGINTPSSPSPGRSRRGGLTYEFVLRKGISSTTAGGDGHRREILLRPVQGRRRQAPQGAREESRSWTPAGSGSCWKEPWPDFMTFYGTSATSSGWIVPKAYVEKVGEDGFKRAPSGGPYKFVSFNPGIELVMEAWDGYWRKTPNVKRLVLRSMPDETTRAAALKKGEVDIAYLLTGPVAEDIQKTPGFKLVAPKESQGTFWLDLPDQWDPKSPWHDLRVGRQRASRSIEALNQAETLGFSYPTGSLIPRVLQFSVLRAGPYDPTKAKLLADAGYPSGSTPATSIPGRHTSRWAKRSPGISRTSASQDPDDGARGDDHRVAREEAEERDRRHHGRRRERRDAARGVRQQERRVHRGRSPRSRTVPAASPGDRREEARSADPPDQGILHDRMIRSI